MATTVTSKPKLSLLRTPMSATYPSEIRSPMVSTPTWIKREDAQNTPVTPPAAYLDFLAKLSPTVASPPASCPLAGSFPSGSFTVEKPTITSTQSSDSVATTATMGSIASTVASAASDQSRPESPRSIASSRSSSCSSGSGAPRIPEAPKTADCTRSTQVILPPQSPFSPALPTSARTPRRLIIPQSPYSPGNVRSPLSATGTTLYSPFSAISPRDRDLDGAGNPRTMSVRQIVTRTVTYAHQRQAPKVEPVPANKKRKLETQPEE
jgi:hypothetical protein